jgi:MFS superfamily sulfate permease-like transporter
MPKRLLAARGSWGDVRGGITSAVVSLGILLPLGLLAFASLGAEGAAIGVRAAFAATICGGLVATIVGGVAIPGTGPRTSTSLIFAGFVASLATDPQLRQGAGHDLPTLLVLTSLCVGLAGLLQVAFGALRLGSLAKFVPLPVVAGFMNGVAVLVAISQLRPLLGLPREVSLLDPMQLAAGIRGGSLALGLATVAFAFVASRRWPKLPWALLGLAAGTLAGVLVGAALPGTDIGPLFGAPAGGLPPPTALLPLADADTYAVVRRHLPQLLTTASVLAIIGSMDTLLAAVGMDAVLNARHRSNRVLVGQGLANVASALVGGMPVTYLVAAPMAAHRAGARGGLTGWVSTAVLLLILLFGSAAVGWIPVTVSAGIMLIIALGLFDQWSKVVWRELRTSGMRDRDAVWSLAVVVIVGIVTVLFGFVASVAAGVLLSMVLFIGAMNRSLVRSVATGATRHSRRIYYPEQARVLRERGGDIRVVELEGAIFFGTAETLAREVGQLAGDARYVVLDIRRVTTIDASGAIALEQLSRRLAAAGVSLLLSGIVAGDRHARALRAGGAFLHEASRAWFGDLDHALEHAEHAILETAGVRAPDDELPLAALSLFAGLDAAHTAVLERHLQRLALAEGETLFRAGEPGDRLYVLAQGSISVLSGARAAGQAAQRLATFMPGVIFGETAMLDGGGRTATAVAEQPSTVYVLTRAALDDIRRDDPALASQILLNLAGELSSRLRHATATINAIDG